MHVTWELQPETIRILQQTYYCRRLTLTIEGAVFRGEGVAHTKNEALDAMVHELRRTAAARGGPEAEALQGVGAELAERAASEKQIIDKNYIGALYTLRDRLAKEPEYELFSQELPVPSADEITFVAAYVLVFDGHEYKGRGEGTTPAASQHLAAAQIFEQLRADGLVARMEEKAAARKGKVQVSHYELVKQRLRDLAKRGNKVTELREDVARSGDDEAALWVSRLGVTVNEREFPLDDAVQHTHKKRKASLDLASEVLLADLVDANIPAPPAQFEPAPQASKDSEVERDPVSLLNEELDRLGTFYQVTKRQPAAAGVPKEPIFTEKPADPEQRFTLTAWTVTIEGHKLPAPVVSGHSKKACEREAARDLRIQVDALKPNLPNFDKYEEGRIYHLGALNTLHSRLRWKYHAKVSKLHKRVESPLHADPPKHGICSFTFFGRAFQGDGRGRDQKPAINEAARDLLGKVRDVDFEKLRQEIEAAGKKDESK